MKRRPEFSANVVSDAFIERINSVIFEGEGNLDIRVETKRPILLIVGAPRSGTTIMLQWLAHVGFATPSNIAARFPVNPYFAGLLQRLMSDPALDFRNELFVPPAVECFRSEYGKTSGLLAPHEFSFYFRRFFPVGFGEPILDRSDCDTTGFIAGLQLFAAAMERPVALKGLLIQYMMDIFAEEPTVFFLHVHRNEADNVCSLLRHRQIVAGDSREWISVKPPQYDLLKTLCPVDQVAGQVHFTNEEIRQQATSLPQERFRSVSHEAFCENPASLFAEIGSAFEACGFEGLRPYEGPDRFEITRYESTNGLYLEAHEALARVCDLQKTV